MKINKNEKGYTLILTLIIILVIVSLFSTFAFGAVTQQKQVEITDDTYEVTAIAEMGVAYYQAKVLNTVELARLETLEKITTFEEEIDEPTEAQVQQLNIDIKKVMADLIKGISEYHLTTDITTAEKVVDSSKTRYFGLYSTPEIKQGLLVMGVKGVIHETDEKEKDKEILIKFKFPDTLVNYDFENGDGDTGEDGNNETLPSFTPILILPNFYNTYPNPFPPDNIQECSDNVTLEKCKTSNLHTLGNLLHNTVYTVKNSNPTNNIVRGDIYNISNLFVQGNLSTNYLKSMKNQSFHINGNISIDGMAKSSNITLHSTGDTSINGNYLLMNSKSYIEGNGNFEYFVITDSDLFTTQNTTIAGQATINTSNLQIGSELTFKDSSVLRDSNIQVLGGLNIQTVDATNTQFQILKDANFNNYTKLVASKIDIRGNANFNGADFSKSDIQISKDSSFSKFVKISSTQLKVLGNIEFNGLEIDNSNINISNKTTFNNDWVKISNSEASFNNLVQNLVQKGDRSTEIVIENNSKVCFKNLTSNIKLNISINSKVYIPDTLKHQNNNLDWAPGKPIYVSESDYYNFCPSSNNGKKDVIDKDDIIDPIYDNNFIEDVEYQ